MHAGFKQKEAEIAAQKSATTASEEGTKDPDSFSFLAFDAHSPSSIAGLALLPRYAPSRLDAAAADALVQHAAIVTSGQSAAMLDVKLAKRHVDIRRALEVRTLLIHSDLCACT